MAVCPCITNVPSPSAVYKIKKKKKKKALLLSVQNNNRYSRGTVSKILEKSGISPSPVTAGGFTQQKDMRKKGT
jgi:hypothetical protein